MADPLIPEEGGIVGPGPIFPPNPPPPVAPQPVAAAPQEPPPPTSSEQGGPIAAPLVEVETAPAPVPPDPNKPRQFDGTDKNLDDPADANQADIEDALAEGPWEAAPQPFRKRDGYPDLTSESVSIRFDRDYYPADRERFQTPLRTEGDGVIVAEPRARAGELKALHSDEAIAVIEAGIGHREDPYFDEKTEDQRRRWKERDEDAERAKEEARRRREDDGA